MNILLTGGAGFIGSHLAEKLLSLGHHVIVLDNFNTFYDPAIKRENVKTALAHPHYTLIEGDILDLPLLNRIMTDHDIDTIIHLAARAGVRPSIQEPLLYQKVNIEGTLNCLEMARKYNVSRVLFASSSSVYGNNEKTPFSETDNVDFPVSPYAATKKAGELLCYNYHHLYQLPIACLRFFTVYGPRQRPEMAIHKFTRLIDNNTSIPVFNEGNCKRDFTYIDDIIHGIVNILNIEELGFDIINLGESETTTTLQLISYIENALGKMATLDLLPAQPGDVETTYADIQHAQKTYAYSPSYPIQLGIQKFVDWYQKTCEKDCLV